MGYAFISYSSKNQQMADSFKTLFNQNGIKTWMAPGDIPFGSTYTSTINRAIKDSNCFVLLLSENAQGSPWVLKETERAISTGKIIFTVLLDDVPMNDDFEFMLSTSQAVAIRKIDESDGEINRLILAIKMYTGEETQANHKSKENKNTKLGIISLRGSESIKPEFDTGDDSTISKKEGSLQTNAKNIELTIWSPVNTDVFLNDKNHLVMRVDHNSGFDYQFNSINVSGAFNLIFVANGFEKMVSFDAASIEDRLEYRLQAILSKQEIRDSYNREEAIEQINIEPTAYAFEQLAEKGTSEDVDLLISLLTNLTNNNNNDVTHDNYLIATCAKALGKLAIKYNRLDDIAFVLDVYANYEAKSSYGWMFDSIVKVLGKTHSRTIGKPDIDETISLIQTKKEIVDGQIAAIQKRYPQYSDVQFCDGSLSSIYRAFDSENNIEVAIKVYSPEVAFHIPFFSDGGLFWDIKKLQADNLCPFIDRQLSEPICLIMRFIQGETLEAHIKSAWLWNDNVESILRFSLGILKGLNALHNINIYYGDLTPRNIIIDKNNTPWLCDFSESNYNGSRYIDKTVLIEKYRSPEKSPGKNIDCRSDIYEFGVILSDFLSFIKHDDSARDALFEIVKKATKDNPDERYQSVKEIIVEINSLLNSDLPKTSNDGVPLEEIFGELSESGTETSDLLSVVPLSDNCDAAILLTDSKNDKRENQQGKSAVALKLKGHLVNSYRRIQDIAADQCGNPIGINMPDGTTRMVDLCDTFAISPQKAYMVAKQKENEEYLFFVFKQKTIRLTSCRKEKINKKYISCSERNMLIDTYLRMK